MAYSVYKERLLNIDDQPYVDLSLNSVDTESVVTGDCQFFAYQV